MSRKGKEKRRGGELGQEQGREGLREKKVKRVGCVVVEECPGAVRLVRPARKCTLTARDAFDRRRREGSRAPLSFHVVNSPFPNPG